MYIKQKKFEIQSTLCLTQNMSWLARKCKTNSVPRKGIFDILADYGLLIKVLNCNTYILIRQTNGNVDISLVRCVSKLFCQNFKRRKHWSIRRYRMYYFFRVQHFPCHNIASCSCHLCSRTGLLVELGYYIDWALLQRQEYPMIRRSTGFCVN